MTEVSWAYNNNIIFNNSLGLYYIKNLKIVRRLQMRRGGVQEPSKAHFCMKKGSSRKFLVGKERILTPIESPCTIFPYSLLTPGESAQQSLTLGPQKGTPNFGKPPYALAKNLL